MTATADPETATYRIIEDGPDRFYAADQTGTAIAGAFKPAGFEHCRICRLTTHTHFVLAPTRQIAEWHVEMLAELFTGDHR
jgi:hypothetical protein